MSGTLPLDLGDGLVLRQATAADTEGLVECNGKATGNWETGEPDAGTVNWTQDLMLGRHPNVSPGDFTVVEDTRTGAVVSSACLIPQTWAYDGIPFGVGQPQLVGTLPAYRRRGLVRAQFEVLHQWSAARGEKVQAITGIPWYYRQFGYELALELGGGRAGCPSNVPVLNEAEEERYRVRAAMEADVPFIAQLYDQEAKRSLVSGVQSEALWQYELFGKSPNRPKRLEWRVIESVAGEPIGYLAHTGGWFPTLAVSLYELRRGASWLAATPAVLRYLQTRLPSQGELKTAPAWMQNVSFAFELGPGHPVYKACSDCLPLWRRPDAWYLRVTDLPDFLRHVAPVLEHRLAESAAAGHTGQLEISFYTGGLRLAFENGRLTAVEQWSPEHPNFGDARFPGLTFLQLLFGYRSLDELEYAFADCRAAGDEARALLEASFPRRTSSVFTVE